MVHSINTCVIYIHMGAYTHVCLHIYKRGGRDGARGAEGENQLSFNTKGMMDV